MDPVERGCVLRTAFHHNSLPFFQMITCENLAPNQRISHTAMLVCIKNILPHQRQIYCLTKLVVIQGVAHHNSIRGLLLPLHLPALVHFFPVLVLEGSD